MQTQPLAWVGALAVAALALLPSLADADDALVQVHEDFSQDPGWEAVNNRVVGVGGPTIRQDFG